LSNTSDSIDDSLVENVIVNGAVAVKVSFDITMNIKK
jgi:hypothetical protein